MGVAMKCLRLCFNADRKPQKMSYDEIQSKIDIILLCRRSSDIAQRLEDEEEEKKEYLEEIKDGENVNEYIRKFAVCREISEWRVLYVMNGGRMNKKINNEQLGADRNLDDFNQRQKEWRHRVMDWNDHIFRLRDDSHLLCYFTINKIRIIIQHLNEYKKSLKNKKKNIIIDEEKKYDDEEERKYPEQQQWQCPTCTVIEGNYFDSLRCVCCNEKNPFLTEKELIEIKRNKLKEKERKLKNKHLFERLLS